MLDKLTSGGDDPLPLLPDEELGYCLDIGCGNGRITPQIHMRCDDLVSIEINQERIREAASTNLGSYCLADGCDLPFENGAFDTVISYTVIEHIPEPSNDQFLSEIRRVIKKGGIAYLINDTLMYRILRKSRILYPTRGPDPTHINMVRPRTLVHRMQRAGFSIETWDSVPISNYVENERLYRLLSDFGMKGHALGKKPSG
jgi:2-polyprenyl-3-methyl-5-hydroxy-6-metoxy-1,4-benzoquinol methylase